jgi:cytochrome c-type biogenesis protein CcmH/NrfG
VRLESGDRAAAAAALRRAAELLVSAGKLGGAEARLARALGHDPEQPSHACALARVRVRNGDLGGAAAAYDHLLGLEGLTGPGPALSHALVEAATFHLDDLEDRAGARPFLEMLVRRAPSDPRVAPLTHRVNGLTQHPPPLARREDEDESEAGDEALEPEVVVDAHARTELFKKSRPPDASEPESESEAESEDEDESASEPDSVFVTDSTEGASPLRASPTAAREALASLGPARSASEPDTRAAELVARGALPTDAGALARLEARAEDDRVRAKISRALADALRREGRHADAALALARAGRATRDAATLRAALDLAERAGAWRSALEVIGLALEVVGAGPARAALERARSRIEALLGE